MTSARLRVTAIFLGVAVALPLIATALLAGSVVDRGDRVGEIPLAIVNHDEIITGDRPMAAGRALSDALVHPDDEDLALGWTVTSEEDAEDGLQDGTYYAVLTIPEDFSAAVLSTTGDEPIATELTLETDPAASATAAVASRVVTEAAADTLGREITEAFISATLTGVDDVSGALAESADGADQLADGAQSLTEGSTQLFDGTAQLADGLDELGAGTADLAAGSDQLSDGAVTLSGGSRDLSRGAASVASGSAQVADASLALAEGNEQLAGALSELAAACPAAVAAPPYCAAVTEASQSAAALASASEQAASGAATTASGAQTLAASATDFSAGAAEYATAAATAASGTQQLAAASLEAAEGANRLADASGELVDGADALAEGTAELAAGLREGADAVPAYTEDDVERLAEVAAEPVAVSTEAASSGAGTLPAAIAAIVLWLAAIGTLASGGRGTGAVALASPAPTWRLAARALRVRAMVGLVQGIATTAVIAAFGFDLGSAIGFGVVSAVAGMSFTLLLSGLHALLGRWSPAAIVALTVLQLSVLSMVVPVQTAPAWVAALDPFLPASALTTLATGATLAPGATAGLDGADTTAAIACLLAWAVVGVALTIVGISGRRRREGDRSAELVRIGTVHARMGA